MQNSDILTHLVPLPPPNLNLTPILAPLDPSQETLADQIGYFYRQAAPIPFYRHAPLPPAGLSAHGAVAASSSQTLAARAVSAALPGIVRQNGPASTLSAAVNQATLDNVPDSIAGGRTAWVTSAQKAAAVDVSGNLLLKNISNVVGTTSGPSTTATSYVVMPEMTVTITTKGNKVLCVFTGALDFNNTTGTGSIAVFRDGSQISQDIYFGDTGTGNVIPAAITFIDGPAAGSHTYDIRWKILAGGTSNTIFANLTQRHLQVVELG